MKGIFFLLLIVHFFLPGARSQGTQLFSTGDSSIHQLTIYAMQSIQPIDWKSPASLYRSVRKGFVSQICRKNQFLLGHLVVRFESPLNENPVFSGMVSSSKKEKRQLVMKEKVGMGILGAALQGHLETGDTVARQIRKYERLGKVAFVRYYINEEAAGRISRFINQFRHSTEGGFSPSSVYGGIFWPRYENEGAGCTAYGMAMLDLAGILGEDQGNWKVDVNIPVNLVGGAFNKGTKVRTKNIRHAGSWYSGTSDSVKAYIPFWIYDPNFMYDWVMKKREAGGDAGEYKPAMEGKIPGVVADRRNARPTSGEPVFLKRTESSVFIDVFSKTHGVAGEAK